MNRKRTIFFAGGGTGGHIYPALAVAEKLASNENVEVRFFCSQRPVDRSILEKTPYKFETLPAQPLVASPMFAIGFVVSLFRAITKLIKAGDAVVVGVGGFVAAPVVIAAKILGKPLAFINVDIVPGTANRRLARLASKIFVQFDCTKDKFGSGKFEVVVCGCPLRGEFDNPVPGSIRADLGLDADKKILFITGASSGAHNINMAMSLLAEKLAAYKDAWQIVHLTGAGKKGDLKRRYVGGGLQCRVLEYSDDMAAILTASEVVIGRCGAVSVAEFIAASVPAICIPYPYHQDDHQRLNAMQMVDKGAAVIVNDYKDDYRHTADELWKALEPMLLDEDIRKKMRCSVENMSQPNAAELIAKSLTGQI